MRGLAAPELKDKVVNENGYNNDIIQVLNDQFTKAVDQTKNVHFSGADLNEKGRAIFNFLKSKVSYKKDPEGKQIIQLPARMIADTKKGDCKSLGLASAAFMYNNGFKNVRLRYASYDKLDNTPTHVYAVGSDSRGNDIIIDPVYRAFNKEANFKTKKDYNMQISVLSGVTTLQAKQISPNNYKDLIHKVRAGGLLYTVITNQKARAEGKGSNEIKYSKTDLDHYVKFLNKKLASSPSAHIKDLLQKEISVASSGNFTGSIYLPHHRDMSIRGIEEEIGKLNLKKLGKKLNPKNLLKGVKTLAFAIPRKAFLSLVFFNFRGIAKKMTKIPESDLKNFWVKKFGGTFSSLQKAINKGKKKRPLFGASKKVKAIKGIGLVIDNSSYIGEGAGGAAAGGAAAAGAAGGGGVSIASIMAVAAPLLAIIANLFKKHNVKDTPEDAAEGAAAGEHTAFDDIAAAASAASPELGNYVKTAMDVAEKTGIIPERPMSINESKVAETFNTHSNNEEDITEPTDSKTSSTGLGIPTPVLLGGAALVAFMLLKKKK